MLLRRSGFCEVKYDSKADRTVFKEARKRKHFAHTGTRASDQRAMDWLTSSVAVPILLVQFSHLSAVAVCICVACVLWSADTWFGDIDHRNPACGVENIVSQHGNASAPAGTGASVCPSTDDIDAKDNWSRYSCLHPIACHSLLSFVVTISLLLPSSSNASSVLVSTEPSCSQ